MLLKRIEMNGFKSFANKTEIIVNDGITGVVGPNGSGKSNIADAIRWVLGEQSYKNLRGTKMQDVIFSGTEKRPRKAFCEVALIFDNTGGGMDSEYSEVAVSRKLYASGEGEYYINNRQVRLKDILDMIRDTGIGKDGYSIIGQGRIDEILISKPHQRRGVFEEAAGIMKYRVRKEEAEHKLQRTQDTLVRVDDIVGELSGQLEPMRAAMEKTKAYLEMAERLKLLEVNLYLHNYDRLNTRGEALKTELEGYAAELAECDEQSRALADELALQNTEYERLIAEGDALRQEIADISAASERAAGDERLTRQMLESIGRELARLNDENARSGELLAAREDELAQLEKQLVETDAQRAEIAVELENGQNELTRLKLTSSEKQAAAAELRLRRTETTRLLSRAASDRAACEASIKGADERLADISERAKRCGAEVGKLKDESERLSERLLALADKGRAALAAVNEKNSDIIEKKRKRDLLREKLAAKNDERSATLSKLRLLTDMKSEYEGYSDSVRNLFKYAKTQQDVEKRLMGTLAELIHVPQRFELAIESALGGALQNVVVRTDRDAQAVISHLHKNELGRVTFLPVEDLKVSLLNEHERGCSREKGFIAVASDAIECGAEVAPAVEFLLARTVIVSDMDAAIGIMRRYDHGFRAVTLSGDIIRPGGVITGGSTKKKQYGLLSRERLATELKERADAIEGEILTHESGLKAAIDAIATAESEVSAMLADIKQADITRAELSRDAASAQSALATANDELQKLQAQERAFSSDMQEKRSALAKNEADMKRFSDEIAEIDNVTAAIEGETATFESELTVLTERVGGLRVTFAEQTEKRARLSENAARLRGEIEHDAQTGAGRDEFIRSLEEQRVAALETLTELSAAARDSAEKLAETKQELEFGGGKRESTKKTISETQRKKDSLVLKRDALNDKRYRAETQAEKLKLNLENAQNRIFEDYDLTYSTALPFKQEINYTDCIRESSAIRAKIGELGTVNPAAIEEYERACARIDELSTQKNDLEKARTDLFEVIGTLMGEMRVKFQERFELVNENFKTTFCELFGGGNAGLRLTDDDIMEAGIEIEAQPPGKRLQSITLLSGGESALTAIALLFALLKINPSPVCLLDEIDAPLDDVNVMRFSNYLRSIKKTQFLIITHKRGTMSVCNTLYGVAMEEKGVSKLVTAKLN